MIDDELNPRSRSDRFGSKINRDHSPVLAIGVPWCSVVLASLTPALPIIGHIPLMPPAGFMMLLAWRLVRPGLMPPWAGLPLGAFDDLLSGQPMGSAILLWSLSMLAVEAIEARFPWRGFAQDWLTASLLLAAYLPLAALIAGSHIGVGWIPYLLPQLLLSILLFPIIARIIASLDRLRLLRIRKLG